MVAISRVSHRGLTGFTERVVVVRALVGTERTWGAVIRYFQVLYCYATGHDISPRVS